MNAATAAPPTREVEHRRRRLAERHRRITRYERVLELDGERFGGGYAASRSKGDLIRAFAPVPPHVADRLTEDGTYTAATGWTFGPVRIYYGRTEREAIMGGELAPLDAAFGAGKGD